MDKKYEGLTVEARGLKMGDLRLGSGKEITKVDVKVKRTHIEHVDGSTESFPHEENVLILRETEESRNARMDAKYRARRNEQIREWFGNYVERANTKAVQAKINEQLSHDGALVDDWTMGAFITAQAKDKVAARLHRAIRIFDEKVAAGEDHPAADLVGAVELVSDRFKEELMQFRGLSRSTSLVSNIMEDADREAQAQFLDRGSFGGWFM